MICRMSVHWVREGMMKEALEQLESNAISSRESGGLVARYHLVSESNPLELPVVTIWESKEHFEKWLKGPLHKKRRPDQLNPFCKIVADWYQAEKPV